MNLLKDSKTKLFLVLLLGFLFRLWAAFHSVGFDHPNEAYRILEPLAHLQGYSSLLPWEWKQGMLSALPIHAHFWISQLIDVFGFHSAFGQSVALRCLYGLISCLQIYAAWFLVKLTSRSSTYALGAALFIALSPELIFRSVRLMDYSLEASFLAAALILLFTRAWILSAVILGLSFFIRYQSGLEFVALFVFLIAQKEYRKLLPVTLAYGITVFGLACLDLFPYLSPFLNYLRFNWIENGAAKLYGVAPWYRYFTELLKIYGFVPIALFLPALFMRTTRKLSLFLLIPLLGHSLTAHKEGRFILGFAWTWVPIAFSGLASSYWAHSLKSKAAPLLITFLFCLMGFGFQIERVSRHFLTLAGDTVEISNLLETYFRSHAKNAPIRVAGDPDFLPGGFFIRTQGPLCYVWGGKQEGNCDPGGAPWVDLVHEDRGWVIK